MSGFAAELRRLRHDRCPSQRRLAERTGIQRTSICRWEGGKRLPDLGSVARMAEALDLSDEELGKLVRTARED